MSAAVQCFCFRCSKIEVVSPPARMPLRWAYVESSRQTSVEGLEDTQATEGAMLCPECFEAFGNFMQRDAPPELEEALEENKRLRGLIDDVETIFDRDVALNICPWCDASDAGLATGTQIKHADDCPAFTPDGEVKTQ